jgi:hypothetical protein
MWFNIIELNSMKTRARDVTSSLSKSPSLAADPFRLCALSCLLARLLARQGARRLEGKAEGQER